MLFILLTFELPRAQKYLKFGSGTFCFSNMNGAYTQFLNFQVLRISYGCPKTIYESLPKCIWTQNFCSLFSHPDHSYIVTSSSGKGKEREKLDCSTIYKVYKRQRNAVQKTHRCLVQRCKIWEHISLKPLRWKGVLLPCFHTLFKVVFIFWFLLETLHLCLFSLSSLPHTHTHTHNIFFFFSNFIN